MQDQVLGQGAHLWEPVLGSITRCMEVQDQVLGQGAHLWEPVFESPFTAGRCIDAEHNQTLTKRNAFTGDIPSVPIHFGTIVHVQHLPQQCTRPKACYVRCSRSTWCETSLRTLKPPGEP
jgi:hypothetical protein